MESEKAFSPSIVKRRLLGWRILLAVIATAGLFSYSRGLGENIATWSGPLLWWRVRFCVPYILVLLTFVAGLATALRGNTRISAVLVFLALAVSIGLFFYDIHHPSRAQVRVGTLEKDGHIDYHAYYMWWWWWAKWGEVCIG
jgi:hypothetical protein